MSDVHYSDYLQLSKILDAQSPITKADEGPDEMLFIVAHQAYELWFKLITYEVKRIINTMHKDYVSGQDLSEVGRLIGRINEILKVLTEQISILETMTPLDFLDFRDKLYPASGFQSVQFRCLEIYLGIERPPNKGFALENLWSKFKEIERQEISLAMKSPNLQNSLSKWLERFPFLEKDSFKFFKHYQKAVENMLLDEKHSLLKDTTLPKELKDNQLEQIHTKREEFSHVFDKTAFDKAHHKFSYEAFLASIFISLYRDEPLLQRPFSIIEGMTFLDENLTQWRWRHALMAQRMLGNKTGTGGSSGHRYLKSTLETGRVFRELTLIPTFLIPRKFLPPLPKSILDKLSYE